MPLFRRMPKRGFSNFRFRTQYSVVNVGDLDEVFPDGAEVTKQKMVGAGLLRNIRGQVKILGDGDLKKKLIIEADKFSQSALQKIAAAGGEIKYLVAMGRG